MTISELQKFLARAKRKHGNIDIITTRFSDYRLMNVEDVNVVQAWSRHGAAGSEWIMQDHYSLKKGESPAGDGWEKGTFIHFEGN